jgi:hypothetical protein
MRALGVLRRAAEQQMPDTATLYRSTTENVGGENVETWEVLAEGVRCGISPIGGGEDGAEGGRVSEETTHLIRLPADSDIEEPDVVVISGVAFAVTQVRKWGSLEPMREIEVEERVSGVPDVE